MNCPCGGKSYNDCCGRFLAGGSQPTTAEELMRSRYCAYATGHIDYIKDTTHPKDQADFDAEAAKSWALESEWMGFEIVRSEGGKESDSTGVIEFIATYRANGKIENHHEISTFTKIDGKWFFADGKLITQVKNAEPKVGRNDPCLCGSGKKYKKCCAN